MKKSRFNFLLYFPTAPAIFKSSDTQPFFLFLLLSNLKGSFARWITPFFITLVFFLEAALVSAPLNPIKILIFVLFIFFIFLLGEFSEEPSTLKDNMLFIIIILGLLSSIFSFEWIFSSREQSNVFRSIPFTFPEASYAAKFFYFHAILKMLQKRKLKSFDLILPISTLSLTGAILSAHLFVIRGSNFFKNIIFIILLVLFLFLLSQYMNLGRLSELLANATNLQSFILYDASFNSRLAYFSENGADNYFTSLLSLLIQMKITAFFLLTSLFFFAYASLKSARIFYIFITTFLILSYSDTYIQPFGVLCLAYIIRPRK